MKIHLIYAHAKNGVIGENGTMPWHLPEDLAHFKQTTLAHPVIMGRKTWDSLPEKFRPLQGRRNLVLSRDKTWQAKGAEVFSTLDEVLKACSEQNEIWVIGGAQIYKETLPLANKIIATEIDAEFTGDAFAPTLGPEWKPKQGEWLQAKNGLFYRFNEWIKL